MDKDTEIKQGLAAAGVAKGAWGTTLPKLGLANLRQAISEHAFLGEEARGIWMYSSPAKANDARTAFYTAAKEMFLTGTKVYCTSLLPLSQMLMDDEQGVSEVLTRAQMVFILDFYESGCVRPYGDDAAVRLRYWMRDAFERGVGVSFLADASMEEVTDWWPQSLVSFLSARVTQYQVGVA